MERADRQAGTQDPETPSLPALLAALLGAAGAWTVHLLASYVVVAYACATGWGGARVTIALLSAASLAAAAAAGLLARRLWLRARAVDRPTDDAWDARMGERTARVSFLMVVGLVLSVLFAVGIVYEAMPLLFVPTCAAVGP
jgi:hypothetical protein